VTAHPVETEPTSTLTIVRPDQFWRQEYLVIVVD
jgi:hypothetical protein